MDSRDSLDQTPDSTDLTKSPLKHTSTQRHIEKINKDTSDNDTDEMITFDEEKANITSMLEAREEDNESFEYNLSSAKQESMEEVESAMNIPVSKDRHQPYFLTFITALHRCR